jgi:hypothetical protein
MDKNSIKVIVAFSFEVVLMKRGYRFHRSILSKLERDHHTKILDCLIRPQFIKTVLKETLGNNYEKLITDLEIELGELTMENEIKDFLLTLRK